MPPAAPLRSRGADSSMVRLLGVWKKPKPTPQRTVPAISGTRLPPGGHSALSNKPAARQAPPAAHSQPVETLSANRPATGAEKATASGQGIM